MTGSTLVESVRRNRVVRSGIALGLVAIAASGSMLLDLPAAPGEIPPVPPGGSRTLWVAFRNDDLSVLSDGPTESRVLDIFRRRGLPQTFAFIPDPPVYQGAGKRSSFTPGIVDSLRTWRKAGLVEFALHGAPDMPAVPAEGMFAGLPAPRQLELLLRGKAFADSVLADTLRIFAPPWNQADHHTLRACRIAGLEVFSGYLAEESAEGIVQVNTNAALFRGETTLPEAIDLLPLLRQRPGDALLVIFYHSGTDFDREGAEAELEYLLASLAADPDIRWSTIGDLSRRQPGALSRCTAAGLAIRRAEIARNRTNPFLLALRFFPYLREIPLKVDAAISAAYGHYWRGEYHKTVSPAGEAVRLLHLVMGSGRLLAAGAVAGLLWGLLLMVRQPQQRRRMLLGTIALIPGSLIGLHLLQLLRPDRMRDLELLAGVCLLMLLAAHLWWTTPVRIERRGSIPAQEGL